ncbi:MAG: adenylate/guanylate cyclase domain-containing protein [Deltaproteobacteria bacterium HGW-Deltaproteobacteria-15]|jgi:class 3 adenylate cyclase|nr:MAG: adenylate/guanylate cyclase domain-containing protein [Deltaproteobacteria bacterium HGW-Deltaproteobacteria-15]
MSQETEMTTILFADICGSTRIYERLGDAAAQKIVSESLAVLSESTDKHCGKVLKTIGDEVMCTFPTAKASIDAACDMQSRISEKFYPGYGRISVRIGLHFGHVIKEGNEIFGDAVNVAARVAALAKSEEIITTQDTADLLASEGADFTLRRIQRIALKGKDEATDIYEVVWQDSSLTHIGLFLSTPEVRPVRLTLLTQNHEIVLEAVTKPFTIGRSKKNDIVVEDEFTSRLHARIECRQGKFFLCDQSINGTYVHYKTGRVVHLHREEMILPDEGTISLGRDLPPEAKETIRFEAKSRAPK